MTFRNTALLFIIFLLLNSCKGLQYYKSGTNPSGVAIFLEVPSEFYTNIPLNTDLTKGRIKVRIANYNSQPITISSWWNDFNMIGTSRFYSKEITMKYAVPENLKSTIIVQPGDTSNLFDVPIQEFLNDQKGWNDKTKPSFGPHKISLKKFYPYIYLSAELLIKVPNQADVIKIRSEKVKVSIAQFKEENIKSKKTELGLSSDISTYNVQDKKGNLFCKINNIGSYPIPLFNDPGSVRFKLYAYNPNRTAIMFTQYILNNGKLPVDPVNINTKEDYTIAIPLEQVLFSEAPQQAIYYWTWNKKSPPISPLVYGKKDIAVEVEFWFGVVVDGKEYLSNTIKLTINSASKKSSKK